MEGFALKAAVVLPILVRMDALDWRRLWTSFKTASDDLCLSARRLCTDLLDPTITAPLLACRLIALNKNPGVCPIGIGETPRRIIDKAILTVTSDDIQEVTGTLQLCAAQISVCAVRELFQNEDSDAILLIDPSNAFYSLNSLGPDFIPRFLE